MKLALHVHRLPEPSLRAVRQLRPNDPFSASNVGLLQNYIRLELHVAGLLDEKEPGLPSPPTG